MQVSLEIVPKGSPNGLGLALAEKAVIDKDARHLLANRSYQKGSGD